jgi:Ca2+-transporting ATPase
MGAVLSTFVLQVFVLYVPFMQDSFGTAPLSLTEMLVSFVLGAVVLFGVELEKLFNRRYLQKSEPALATTSA